MGEVSKLGGLVSWSPELTSPVITCVHLKLFPSQGAASGKPFGYTLC